MPKSNHRVEILEAMAKLPAGFAPMGGYDPGYVEGWLDNLPENQRAAGVRFYAALCQSEPHNAIGTGWIPRADQLIAAAFSTKKGKSGGSKGMTPQEVGKKVKADNDARAAEQEAAAAALDAVGDTPEKVPENAFAPGPKQVDGGTEVWGE